MDDLKKLGGIPLKMDVTKEDELAKFILSSVAG
jgi:hypothetical protein